jgi:hypothetical protein
MRYCFRILSIAFLSFVAALAGCNAFESSDNAEPAVQPDHTVTKNVAGPVKPGPQVNPPPSVATKPVTPGPAPAESAAVAHFNTLLVAAWSKVQSFPDMSCRLVQTQVVDGVTLPEEVVDFRQRFSPHSLRLTWVGKRNKGRDLVYVAGQNDNKVLVKEPGAVIKFFTGNKPVSIALDSTALTSQSKDAPDFAGYNLLIGSIRMRFNDARASNLAWVSEARPETVGERRLQTFEVTLQAVVLSGQIKQMAITFDLVTSLPVHMIMRDAKNRVVQDYDWQNLRLGVGLTDADFRFETPK